MPAKSDYFKKLNLMPADEFERSFLGKAMSWALTAGKSIVVITEFVVILAFLSRFKLDRDMNDINDVIMQKQAVLSSYGDTEERMRRLQERLDIYNDVKEKTLGAGDELDDLVASTPIDVTYEMVDISKTQIQLSGVAGSEVGFSALLNALKSSEKWEQISLGGVEFSQRKGGIVFRISGRAVGADKMEGGSSGN